MIEAPLALQESLKIPQNHLDVCAASGTPDRGNAAGNTVDLLDLTGENKAVAPLPGGFTARGIVALVFSCISAFLGMAVIAWYVSPSTGEQRLAACLSRLGTRMSVAGNLVRLLTFPPP